MLSNQREADNLRRPAESDAEAQRANQPQGQIREQEYRNERRGTQDQSRDQWHTPITDVIGEPADQGRADAPADEGHGCDTARRDPVDVVLRLQVGHAPEPGEGEQRSGGTEPCNRVQPRLTVCSNPAKPRENRSQAAAATAAVAHEHPGRDRQGESDKGHPCHGRAPAAGVHRHAQRRLAENAAHHAEHHGETGEQGELPARKPLPGHRHGADETEGASGTDEKPAHGCEAESLAPGEQNAGHRHHDGRDAHQASRTETIEQQTDGYLHSGVTVEIKSGEVAEDGATDGKVAHQLFDHDARRNAQDPGVEEEKRSGQPAEQRKHAGRPGGLGSPGRFRVGHVAVLARIEAPPAAGTSNYSNQ